MLRPRALVAIAGLLALLIIGAASVLRARSRPQPAAARRPSPWVVPRAQRIPKLITAPTSTVAERSAASANLIVRVEDVEGGAIPYARLSLDQRDLGATDEAGRLRLDTRALGLPDRGELEARATGYGPLRVPYAVPGEVLFKLIVGSVLGGRVVQAGTDVGVAGLQVTANRLTTTSDPTGRFTIRDLPAA